MFRSTLRKGVSFLVLAYGLAGVGEVNAFGCCDPCPCEGPLNECHWRIGVRGGVDPTWYTDKTKNLLIGETGTNGVVATSRVPDFDEQFKTPWTVGGHIGYSFSDHIELFIDGEYTQGGSDTYKSTFDPFEISQEFTAYKNWSMYFGARYYFCSWDLCGKCVSPFIGGKLGFRNYKSVDFKEELVGPVDITFGSREFYENHTVPSLGGQIGLELFCNRCFSINIMAEFVYSGQLRSVYQLTNGGVGVQTVSIGDTGPLFDIPITIGINYSL